MPPADGAPPPSAPPAPHRRWLPRSRTGLLGAAFLALIVLLCVGSLPWTLAPAAHGSAEARYSAGRPREGRLPPSWWPVSNPNDIERFNTLVDEADQARIAAAHGLTISDALKPGSPASTDLRRAWPQHRRPLWYALGSDGLGRSLAVRCLAGGGISLGIGIAAAFLSVLIGTLYGALSAYAGGLVDAVMMRIVDILYGLPYILLVVLLKVAVDAAVENRTIRAVEAASAQRDAFIRHALAATPEAARTAAATDTLRQQALERFGTGELSPALQNTLGVVVLLVAIGGVSWLTMARVIRGQVLSLKAQPFMEAARAVGVGWPGQFRRHLLPNLVGPIIVYATLTIPQAILQESFLSFLGIGVRPPLPSWGNLAADGLGELNPYRSNWWLLLFPCLLLGATLLALNFVGEALRESLDPKSRRR